LARDPARAKLIFISLPHTAKSCASECHHESVVTRKKVSTSSRGSLLGEQKQNRAADDRRCLPAHRESNALRKHAAGGS